MPDARCPYAKQLSQKKGRLVPILTPEVWHGAMDDLGGKPSIFGNIHVLVFVAIFYHSTLSKWSFGTPSKWHIVDMKNSDLPGEDNKDDDGCQITWGLSGSEKGSKKGLLRTKDPSLSEDAKQKTEEYFIINIQHL